MPLLYLLNDKKIDKMKPYKASAPSVTINKIRKNLDEVGIFLQEASYSNDDCLFTSRVNMSGIFSPLNIGTNGKGTTYDYALASGYAEFMERLQNNMLFRGFKNAEKHNLITMDDCFYKKQLMEQNLALDFLYDPNEINIKIETEVHEHLEFIKSLFPFIENETEAVGFFRDYLMFKDCVCVPFYSDENKGEIMLPIELVHISCGSNGMASGNTKEEALIQGFCEIFERYAGSQIYNKNLTPPTIPISAFSDYPVYSILEKLLADNKYKLIIKDCSLGKGLPVLGVLVIDEKKGMYNFNLGSALNPGIALERCLTELYQSATGLSWYEMKFEKYADNPKYEEAFIFVNGNKLFLDGSGDWGVSLFKEKPSYEYHGLNKSLDVSDEGDIAFIKKLVYSLGFKIYIRDVSFMGLNSYYIVIPGMSQFPTERTHYEVLNETYYSLQSLRDIEHVPIEKLKDLCRKVNADYKILKMFNFNFNEMLVFHRNQDLLDLSLEQLLFMLNYKAGLSRVAYSYIQQFLKDKDFAAYKYYYGIRDYLKLKMEKCSDDEIEDTLKVLYEDELKEIIEDMEDAQKVLQCFKWPQNFRCERCDLLNDCCQFELLRVMKKIQKKHQDAHIDHKHFIF